MVQQQHMNMTLVQTEIEEIATLYQRYAPALYAYLLRRVPRGEDAEDLLVEVFLAALENKRFSAMLETAQRAWLWRVARNKTVDSYRRSTHRKERSVTLESIAEHVMGDDGVDPERSVLRQEEYAALQRHLKRLSPLQQRILQMRFGQDMRCSEIAEHLGKHEGAIKTMLWRTINLLKDMYQAWKEE